jgi:predicted DNA-binding protein
MLDLDSAEKQRIQRANQMCLRLKKELHDRGAQFTEKDVREAAQSARWLREIIERYPGDWEQVYEDALVQSDLTQEDKADLQRGIREAGGFSPFVQRNLRKLEDAASGEREQTGDAAAEMTRQALACGVAASLVVGGVLMENFFYFGFAVGMLRKSDCW